MHKLSINLRHSWRVLVSLLFLLSTLTIVMGKEIQAGAENNPSPRTGEFHLPLSVVPQVTTGLTISGQVYFDSNGDGIFDDEEPGIEEARVELWLNNSMVAFTNTDVSGAYSFPNLSTNIYTVVQIDLIGFARSTLSNVTLSLTDRSENGVDFGLYIPLTITGTVYNDRNVDGFRSLNEEGIQNAQIEIFDDANTNAKVDAGEAKLGGSISDAQGNYAINGISPGNRVLRIIPPGGLSTPDSGQYPVFFASSEAGGNSRIIDLALIASEPLLCAANNLIDTKFNGSSIPGGSYIWFTSHIKVKDLGTWPAVVKFDRSVIKFSVGATPYELVVPAGEVYFLPTATSTFTLFDANGTWKTTVSPGNNSKYLFLSGLAFPVPVGGLPGKISPITWTGRYQTTQPGLGIEWAWSAAVYSQFNTNYNSLGVKAVDGSLQNLYANSNQAGTPENFKNYLIPGARSKGGANYTGDWSAAGYAAPCASPTSLVYIQRVNAGSTTYTQADTGSVWSADKAFRVGSWGYRGGSARSLSTPVEGTNYDLLYQTYRENMNGYTFSALPGRYEVTLHFAEFIAKSASERVMRISIEGNVVESSLSIFGATGGRNIALQKRYEVNLSDGLLDINFAKQSGGREPIVSAIEVRSLDPLPPLNPTATPTATPTSTPLPTATPTATPSPYSQAVNSGSTSYTDMDGRVWSADRTYTPGSWGRIDGAARSASGEVSGTGDDLLYQRYIEKPGEYRFTVPDGTYEVTIKMVEFIAKTNSERVFSILMEGNTTVSNLSIFERVGRGVALDLTYDVTVQDGILNVAFVKAAGSKDPVISAIAVRKK